MAENEPDENAGDRRQMSNAAKFSGIGFQMLAIIGLFTYVGYKIDQSANHQTKWVTAILSLTGVFISLYVVIRSVKND
jgi:hypothetical protein